MSEEKLGRQKINPVQKKHSLPCDGSNLGLNLQKEMDSYDLISSSRMRDHVQNCLYLVPDSRVRPN
jgi:hypothetical protein